MDRCEDACCDCEDIGDFFHYKNPVQTAENQAREYCFREKRFVQQTAK
jgi:hypothetical protein